MSDTFADFVMKLSDKKLIQLFADMGIHIDLNGPVPLVFEDVEQEIIDQEFDID
mgnify:CR=1 FL=1|jgi:hypothetical protein